MQPGRWMRLFTALLVAGVCAAAARADDRVALVIGNSAYEHLPVLDSPRNDAAAIAEKLQQLGFNVTVGIDLDRAATDSKLRQFRHVLARANTALFYYAGHGVGASGRDFLVPIDADLADAASPEHGIVDLWPIIWGMQHGPHVSLIFVDASRDDPLANAAVPPATADPNPPEDPARMVILLATGPGGTVAHGEGDAHSPFTSALLQHMDTPGLKIRDMLTLVRDDVVKSTGGGQTPWSMSSLVRDFVFAAH